jgi:regulatory protein
MPVITDIAPYKGSTVRIDLDEGESLFINSEIVYSYNLQKGMEIPKQGIEQLLHDNELRKAKERGLYLMDYGDNTYAQLFGKLRRNYSEDICYEVCDKLAEIGVINDRRYAENLARRLVEVKLMGHYRAVNDMKQKGLPKSIIDEALAPYAEGERERLRELIEKKYMNKLDYEDRNCKVTASLVRYGYSFDDIRAVLRKIEQEID